LKSVGKRVVANIRRVEIRR